MSSNEFLRKVLDDLGKRVRPRIKTLLGGGSFERVLNDTLSLSALSYDEDALWTLLVSFGYLRAEMVSRGRFEQPAYRLSIPNREVRDLFERRLS